MQTDTTTFPDTAGRNAAAWSWVMDADHHRIIVRTCARMAAKSNAIERDELESATILRCVTDFDKFDPGKGSVATWVFWQARREKKALERIAGLGRETPYPVGADPENGRLDPIALTPAPGGVERMEARAGVAMVSAHMPQSVRDAVACRAAGMSDDEITSALGISRKSATRRVRRWRESTIQ